jgi:hypothetical protein
MNCAQCGRQQERWRDKVAQREHTNIDPFTGLCVDCLIAYSRKEKPAEAEPFDHKRAAAGGDREE